MLDLKKHIIFENFNKFADHRIKRLPVFALNLGLNRVRLLSLKWINTMFKFGASNIPFC